MTTSTNDPTVNVLVPLDKTAAERLDKRIRLMAGTTRDNFAKLAGLVDEAKAGQIHQALGFRSWTAYLADALGGQVAVEGDTRRELVCMLAGEGMSVRAIASATGTSKSTVDRDLNQVSHDGTPEPEPQISQQPKAPVTGLDGKNYRRPQPKKPDKPNPNKVMLTLLTHDGTEVKYPKPQGKPTFNETTGPGISWAAWSWNPVTGCLHGCKYCYARDIATSTRFADAYPAKFTPLFHHERLTAPANTTIPVKHADDPAYRRVFVCSMADLYGRWVPDEWIEQVHAAMVDSPQWQYITLTKFPDRYPAGLKLPEGAWVGTSVDEQKRVRIAERAFAALPDGLIKWLSLEPLLEPLEFTDLSMFDWIVIGAQTQTRQPTGIVSAFAPPFEWVARIVAQAREAGCRIHMKPNLHSGPGMQLLNEYPAESK